MRATACALQFESLPAGTAHAACDTCCCCLLLLPQSGAPAAGGSGGAMEVGATAVRARLSRARERGALDLSSLGLEAVPGEAFDLDAAVPLRGDAGDWSKRDESQAWWECADAITKVQLSRNAIAELPPQIGVYEDCEWLDVSHNRLQALPSELGALRALRRLDANNNRLVTLPSAFAQMPQLASVDVSHNALRELDALAACACAPNSLADVKCGHNQIDRLPGDLANCKLRRLEAPGNRLTEIAETLPPTLEFVDLSCNMLQELPEDIGRCQRIEYLSAHTNRIVRLPRSLGLLDALRELHLRGNSLTVLPEELSMCDGLRMLDLSDNLLNEEALAPICGLKLERLLLENNRLRTLPPELGFMRSLQVVTLAGNPLKMIPQATASGPVSALLDLLRKRTPACAGVPSDGGARAGSGGATGDGIHKSELSDAHTEGRLSIAGRRLERFPASALGLGERLKRLDASGNFFVDLLDGVGCSEEHWAGLTSLRELDFSDCQRLKGLPTKLSALPTLETLRLQRCRGLLSLSPPLPLMESLRVLDLSGVGLGAGSLLMDAAFEDLPSLTELRIAQNSLTRLPVGLSQCIGPLQILDVSNNALSDVGRDALHKLADLTMLDLGNNNLRGVPDELGSMPKLRQLVIGGNPFKQPPLRVLDKGTEATKAWLRKRAGVED